ncbi:Uncharacterised protein [Yersinia massiliensis]|nr:Uncharacterised protein [Yersinia massiliensis]
MPRCLIQQTVNAMTCRVNMPLCQLNAHASDIHRQLVGIGHFCRPLQILVSAELITTLLSRFCRQQIVHHRLLSMIGVAREQLLDLFEITFGQFDQRGLCLLTGAGTFAAHKPAASTGTGAEDPAQYPFNDQEGDQNQH